MSIVWVDREERRNCPHCVGGKVPLLGPPDSKGNPTTKWVRCLNCDDGVIVTVIKVKVEE